MKGNRDLFSTIHWLQWADLALAITVLYKADQNVHLLNDLVFTHGITGVLLLEHLFKDLIFGNDY